MTSVFGTERVAYPGLRAFGREEFDLFFGRESCVDEMVDTLGRTSFLAVLGTSGSGKSSLVRTGLLNALELGFLASAGSTWRIAELRPRGHPIRSLAVALLEVQGIDQPDEAEIEILSAFLRRGPRSLVEWASSGHLPPRANLMVLVDQFEELFRYQDYSGREEAEAFVGLLVTAARDPSPIHVAITMRSEYLGACTLIEGLPEVINRGLYLTPRMTREECRQAIVGPAEVCGFRIEDRLVNKLLNDLTDFAPWEAGGGHDQQRRLGRRADQLPLMQHVLNLLWQRARARNETDIVLTLADYEAAGGLGGALDRHADEIAATVPAEHQHAIDPVFRSLVTGRTIEDAVRRPTRFGEIVALDAGAREAVAAVVDAFRAPGVNFLTPGAPDPVHDDTIIDISHESLIRQWRRLSRCLDEEAHSADAWNQLLTRAERHADGAGGLLTGLDLDNLVDWWKRTQPIPAWADRYGNHFAVAEKYLRDSQFAEADRKRRDEEEERKLLAAEQEANTGRRFKRLAGALAAALIIAFGAVGAAIYLWRESNAEALAALEAQAEADRQRQIAEAARTEAEEQRAIAEAEAAAAEVARAEADKQRAIAEAERIEAERARALAEAAEQAAILARRQADQIIDTSIAYFAKSLGDEVAAIQDDPAKAGDLGYAGGLLSRLAGDARERVGGAGDIDMSFVAALRPAFVVQDVLSANAIPAVEPAAIGKVTRWIGPPGASGLNGAIDWGARSLRLSDASGRVVALYDLPSGLRANDGAGAPLGAFAAEDAAPVAVLADAAGQMWLGAGGSGPLVPVAGDVVVGRIDDVAAGPDGEILVGFALGETAQQLFGSPRRIAQIVRDGEGWRLADLYRLPPGPEEDAGAPLRFAGLAGGAVLTVADGAVYRTRLADGAGDALWMPAVVVDAAVAGDGRYILAGGPRDDTGACFGGGRSGALDPWRSGGDPGLRPAGLVITDRDPDVELAPAPPAPVVDCLLLYDLDAELPLWRGAADDTRIHTARLAEDGAVEVVEGVPPGLATRRIAPADGAWADRSGPFDRGAWGLAGLSDSAAGAAALRRALPTGLSRDLVRSVMADGVLRPLAELPPGGRILAWRVAADEVQVARVVEAGGIEASLDLFVYRPGQDGFIRDDRIDAGRAACVAVEGRRCRFDAAAFSPDGHWLLVASNGSHAFIGRSGILGGWESNAENGDGGAAAPTFTMIEPMDVAGRVFVAAALEDGSLRRITRLAATPQPQGLPDDRFVRQARGPDLKAGEGGNVTEGAGGTGGGSGGGSAASVVSAVRLPGNVASDRSGFATDPVRGRLYVWGPRTGVRVLAGDDGNALAADVEFPAPVADVAILGDGDAVAVTTDGQVAVIPAGRFRGDGGTAGPGAPLPMIATGLGGSGIFDVWAGGERVVLSAGAVTVDGIPQAPGAGPLPDGDADVGKVRSLGYHRGDDGGLVADFVVPWDHIAGQMSSGEALSVDGGGAIHAVPKALPGDDRLLALAVMREEAPARETPELEIGFDMLHMRFVGEDDEMLPPAACGWALEVVVRMGGAIEDNISDAVRRSCDEPAATAPLVDAMFDDRIDERIGALLRLAPGSALARAMLESTLRAVAPDAAAALSAPDADRLAEAGQATLTRIAESGDRAALPAPPADAGADPFAHWIVALGEDRRGADADVLADALYHYGYAERLFGVAGVPAPPAVVTRRLALARTLSDDVVLGVFARLAAAPLDPAPGDGAEPALEAASLDAVSAWLDGVAGGDEDKALRLRALAGLVEEMKGDEIGAADAARAAGHYRQALAIVIDAPEAISGHAGILGRIEDAQDIGLKLAALGDPTAKADVAAAVLDMIDAALGEPVRRDVDPPELRPAILAAFSDLAAAGEQGYDLDRFRALGLKFLEFDWESRYQSINQVGAERFQRELRAAEAFASAALDQAAEADRAHWLALRGRMRFWLSTLEFEGLPEEPSAFRDWLAGALADYAAAGGPPAVSLWDATIIGGANSRMVELAASDAEAIDYAGKASDAFRNAIARDGTQEGHVGPDGKPDDFLDVEQYRRRLTFDGNVLALERAMVRLRDNRLLAGLGPQPGEAGYDRAVLADLAYASLDFARRREALRAEAEVNGLLERGTSWSLDTPGDAYWGAPAAELGAMLRREAGLNPPADLCERLAAHPYDVMRGSAAVDYDALDVDAALRACGDGTARDQYHQARALSKANTASPQELLRLLLPSARAGLPVAYNNISTLVSDAGGGAEDAQRLMTTFSELSLIAAYPEIAVLLREQMKSASRAETFEWLAHKAADLGVPEAYVDIAGLTPDVLTQALNYMIARDLYREQGRPAEADAMQARLDGFGLSSGNVASLAATAAGRYRVAPVLLDDAFVTRIEDLLWDARSQATLR